MLSPTCLRSVLDMAVSRVTYLAYGGAARDVKTYLDAYRLRWRVARGPQAQLPHGDGVGAGESMYLAPVRARRIECARRKFASVATARQGGGRAAGLWDIL